MGIKTHAGTAPNAKWLWLFSGSCQTLARIMGAATMIVFEGCGGFFILWLFNIRIKKRTMKSMQWDAIWIHGQVATCESLGHILADAAVAVKDGKIAWVGTMQDLPAAPDTLAAAVHDVNGYLLTPGLIDCHTHLVYAGNRAHEFEQRLQGVSYEEIARAGGGIQSTVTATRVASEEQLFAESLPRAQALQRSGVTTLEIKSGYGLDWQTEAKILRVAKRIGEVLPLTIKRTFLGAHTVPVEYRGKTQEYVDLVCNKMIPQVAEENLADAVDVFCETIAFNLEQTEQVFVAAQEHKLQVKCHGEQLACSDSASLSANYNALSVDHLEFASESGIKALAAAGTVAVLLPGAFYFLREKQMPPVAWMRQYGVAIAIASDCNPGTSPNTSLTLTMNMACTLFRMTPAEVLFGVTNAAAQALGIKLTHGSLTVGKEADIAMWAVKSPAELCYNFGNQPLTGLVKSGNKVQL
jgi:imidazolonepropionase